MPPGPPELEIVPELHRLPPRAADSHKGHFGRILVVAGSRGMSGAAVLCASAALRGGAGLVRLAVPHEIQPLVAVANPCFLTAGLGQDAGGQFADSAEAEVLALAQTNDVVAAGPGLGRGPAITALVLALLDKTATPLVLDADGLNVLQNQTERLARRSGGAARPVIMTPHPGEFARLIGSDIAAVQGNRQELAVRFAAEHHVVLVLKGHQTIVTDSQQLYENTTGNPGMATGGTG